MHFTEQYRLLKLVHPSTRADTSRCVVHARLCWAAKQTHSNKVQCLPSTLLCTIIRHGLLLLHTSSYISSLLLQDCRKKCSTIAPIHSRGNTACIIRAMSPIEQYNKRFDPPLERPGRKRILITLGHSDIQERPLHSRASTSFLNYCKEIMHGRITW